MIKNKCLFLLGCVLFFAGTASFAQGITNAEKVKKGMTASEVADLMGATVTIGYQNNPQSPGTFDPITMSNPARKEQLKGSSRVFEVVYYITDVKKADDKVTDDELTPFVFEKDRFIGKGWSFLGNLISKYKLN